MKNDNILKKYQSKIFRESLIKSLIYGLIAGFAVIGIVSLFLFIIGTKNLIVSILFGIVAMAFSSWYVYKTKFKPTVNAVAKRIDELGLHERVVTMVDYADNDSLICVKQREDTQEKLAKVEVKSIKFRIPKLSIALLAVLAILAGSSMFLPDRGSSVNANNSTTSSTSSSKNSSTLTVSSSSIPVEDQIDEIIQKMIEEIRRIIDSADISDTSKEKLHSMVNDMVEELDKTDSLSEKIKILQDTKADIYHQIDLMKSVSLSLQESETTKTLGQAISLAENTKDGTQITELINAGVDGLINELANSEDPEAFINDLIAGLEFAVETATEEENEALMEALANLVSRLKGEEPEMDEPTEIDEPNYRHNLNGIVELANDQANSALDEARQEIIDALLPPPPQDPIEPTPSDKNSSSSQQNSSNQQSSNQDQSSNQNQSSNQEQSGGQQSNSGMQNSSGQTSSSQEPMPNPEEMQGQINDQFQNALDQLEKIEQEDPMLPDEELPSQTPSGQPSSEQPTDKPIFDSGALGSEAVIDGQTPYLDVYDEYYDEIMDYLAGNEIPDDLREIIEAYLEMIKG